MVNLKHKEHQRQKTEERKAEDDATIRKQKNHKKQRLATLKRLKRGDDKVVLRLEKVVTSKQLRFAVEIEEERRE